MNGRLGRLFAVAALLIGACGKALAAPVSLDDIRCARLAAAEMRVSTLALLALRIVEGGDVGTVSWNKNGTADVGPMQINSTWFERFRAHGVTPDVLTHNRCASFAAGAWILRYELDRAGGDWVVAIGRYHSPTPWRAKAYSDKVVTALRSLLL